MSKTRPTPRDGAPQRTERVVAFMTGAWTPRHWRIVARNAQVLEESVDNFPSVVDALVAGHRHAVR